MRRTTEQPSQNFFTDERTFIPLCCCSNEINADDAVDADGRMREAATEGGLSDVVVAVLIRLEEHEEDEQCRTCVGADVAVRL